ncbi:protein phosphatase 1 regulatory subunit 3C-B-like [Myripristis murdjan]|uniref:protein phosphatase 1 regulatory subunit 3C-B-like n=1 Tax=Myripristis murdjan TaxID=586833 RepID=UPI0011761264|nr:protein phosphatase 1 regulatory subunit 3C-B-like [Myripristis murdjan]
MNCTRILHILNPQPGVPSPIMPVDMAMRICLASSPPLHSFLGNYDNHCASPSTALLPRCEPLRPCLASGHCAESSDGSSNSATATATMTMTTTTSVAAAGSRVWPGRKKKSVVFADSRGLALTAVHVFNEAEDDLLAELQFLADLEGATATLRLGDYEGPAERGSALVLDFTQPAADYLDLRNRLKAQQVCLESCSVQEHSLSGTVQVRNIGFEKSVAVRITFDSWRSFQDVPCRYLNNVYGCPDIDTFSFSIPVPEALQPSERVEFCLQYQAQDQTFWDNNHGNNYRLLASELDGNVTRGADRSTGLDIPREKGGDGRSEVEFDPFGSPRTSAGIFPEWQSWGRIENTTPYW